MSRKSRIQGALDFLFLLLAVAGFLFNLILLNRRLLEGPRAIAGCGGGACDELLFSRWSVVFGIPVTACATAVYFLLIGSSTGLVRGFHRPLLGVVLGAACWFTFVQAVILGSFCSWCMAAHGLGVAVVFCGAARMSFVHGTSRALKSIGTWMVAGFLGTGLAQVYGPVPSTHRIDEATVVSRLVAASNRTVVFDGGRRIYHVSGLPCLGRADAKYLLAEYFDYQCPACRTMAGYLDALVDKYPASVGVLLLPVPLERSCNSYLFGGEEHPGSCETARIALAVWREAPAAFEAFHHALLADPSPENAREAALDYLSPVKLEAALEDPWIDELLSSNAADWRAFSGSTNKLPKLLIRDRRILHGLPSGEAEFIRVIEEELGL